MELVPWSEGGIMVTQTGGDSGHKGTSLVVQLVKILPALCETWVDRKSVV